MKSLQGGWQTAADIQLSIVVTNYNYAAVLPRAIGSVLSQLSEQVELVLVDDGSSDGSADLLQEYAVAEGVQAGYLVQKNAGPAAARNRAMQLVRGEWVLFLDADDALCDGAVQHICAALKADPQIDLLLGGHMASYANGREKYRPPSRLAADRDQRLRDYFFDKKVSISHGCSVFRSTAVRQRPYPEHLRQGEDIAVFAWMLLQPHGVSLDVPLAIIYKHSDSLRNDVALTITNAGLVAESVFASMPSSLQPLRARYEAKRALSAFRSCYRAGRLDDAAAYYRAAFKVAPRQALRWDYFSKWLRMQLKRAAP